jgi:hypothetical protein
MKKESLILITNNSFSYSKEKMFHIRNEENYIFLNRNNRAGTFLF